MKLSIGIDISKRSFDVALYDGVQFIFEHYEYTESGIVNFISKLKRLKNTDVIITMEATGIYHLRLAIPLYQEGYTLSVVNPLVIKRFSQMKLSRVKTDKADAKIIAEYGYKHDPCLYTPEKAQNHQIKQLLNAINGIMNTVSQITCRIKTIECDPLAAEILHESLLSQKKFLLSEVKKLEKEILQLISEIHPREYMLLLTIPGIGKRMAAATIAQFNAFETFDSPKKISSFIGMCPSPHHSGTSIQGSGYISKKGNNYYRKTLYMATLSAFIHNKQCKDLFDRLVGNGKNKKQALIAVANKLIKQMYGVIKNGVPYDKNYL